ncbi:MAG TPA: hypothetical protein H9668_00850 [Firmicutes bacterium]|nr:hypothetical protein [Bacillota bacterium]
MGQATEQKEKEQRRLVTANRPYLIFMALALTVVGACGVGYACFDSGLATWSRILLGVGGGFLLASSVFAWYILTVYMAVEGDSLTVKFIHTTRVQAADISYIEWTYFNARPGNCYVNTKDGRSILLQKKMFSRELLPVLSDFGERNGITQRGLEEIKKK